MKTLEAVCPKCSKATIENYRRGIQRLQNLMSEKSLNLKTGGWLIKPELKKAFEKLPLSKRRSLSVSGLKASKMYGSTEGEKYWSSQMFKDSEEYQKQRAKNEKSPTEKEKWTGFASLKKASTEYKRSIGAIFKNKTHTTKLTDSRPLRAPEHQEWCSL